jgi:hypothetical protein
MVSGFLRRRPTGDNENHVRGPSPIKRPTGGAMSPGGRAAKTSKKRRLARLVALVTRSTKIPHTSWRARTHCIATHTAATTCTRGGALVDRQWPMPDYAAIVSETKLRYDVRVRRWRRSMTGCAWQVTYDDGSVINWIEAPRPKTPISLAVFLHEVGHHVIGFDRYRLRCEEELYAWEWAIAEMRSLGVGPDEKVDQRVELSMRYAVSKAQKRGLKQLPSALHVYSVAT